MEIDYIRRVSYGNALSKDSISVSHFFVTQDVEEANGRYEGFLLSGKIHHVESELQNAILKLYQEQVLSLNTTILLFENRKDQIITFIQQHSSQLLNDKANLVKAMSRNEVQNMLSSVTFSSTIANRYQVLIDEGTRIVASIDKGNCDGCK